MQPKTLNKILIILLIFSGLTIASLQYQKNQSQFFTAVGKIESDADFCLNKNEIKAIQNAKVTNDYKNYLFESDMRKRQAINQNNQSDKFINCEL